MADSAWAGHAGEAGASVLSPELTGVLALIAILLAGVLIIGLVALWLLVRIDRRLRAIQKADSFPK